MRNLCRVLICINTVAIRNTRCIAKMPMRSFYSIKVTDLKFPKCNLPSYVFLPLRYSQQSPKVEKRKEYSVTIEEFDTAIQNDEVLVIDVRQPEEVAEGRVPATRYINIPVKTISQSLSLSDNDFLEKFGVEKPKKNERIVFHCLGGVRSTYALYAAQEIGYKNSKHLPGGWDEWSTTFPNKKV